jgi:NTP pyrophosphatase (non-canonical NTP hydrolase)
MTTVGGLSLSWPLAAEPRRRAAGRGAAQRESDEGILVHIREFQQLIDRMYSDKDRRRGSAKTFLWLAEEVGELASAIAGKNTKNKEEEFADVLAWLVTLANVEGVDLEQAIRKFTSGCPGCGQMVCRCEAKLT